MTSFKLRTSHCEKRSQEHDLNFHSRTAKRISANYGLNYDEEALPPYIPGMLKEYSANYDEEPLLLLPGLLVLQE